MTTNEIASYLWNVNEVLPNLEMVKLGKAPKEVGPLDEEMLQLPMLEGNWPIIEKVTSKLKKRNTHGKSIS